MVIRPQNDIVLRLSLFDDSLEIDDDVLTIFSRHLDFALVGEITKPTGADDRFAYSVNLIRWNFLRTRALTAP